MKENLKTLLVLSIASTKMYFRDFTAIFFTLIFPAIFLIVFGFINSNDQILIDMTVINNSESQVAAELEQAVVNNPVFEDQEDDDLESVKEKINDGDIRFALVIPEEFGQANIEKGEVNQVSILINEGADVALNETSASIIRATLEGFNNQANIEVVGAPPIVAYELNTESVSDNDLETIDYVIPGIIGFSIMSLGIFSIAQGFITYKSSGALRRLFVAPIHPISFILAQSAARLIMTIVNVWTMLLMAIALFSFTLVGDLFTFTTVSIIGAILFLGIGFAIAGWAKNENQAAPMANIIFFPMMFLSGTFFPREVFPEWLQPIAELFPLSYLTDALRLVANEGAQIWELGSELIGMFAWTIIVYIIAVKIFRWE